jgi:hypothetical protein
MEDSSRRYEPLDIKEGVEPPYRLIDRDSTFKQSNGALNIRRVGAGRRAHLSDWFHTVINQATYDMKRITLRVLAPCFDISFIVTCGNDVLCYGYRWKIIVGVIALYYMIFLIYSIGYYSVSDDCKLNIENFRGNDTFRGNILG